MRRYSSFDPKPNAARPWSSMEIQPIEVRITFTADLTIALALGHAVSYDRDWVIFWRPGHTPNAMADNTSCYLMWEVR